MKTVFVVGLVFLVTSFVTTEANGARVFVNNDLQLMNDGISTGRLLFQDATENASSEPDSPESSSSGVGERTPTNSIICSSCYPKKYRQKTLDGVNFEFVIPSVVFGITQSLDLFYGLVSNRTFLFL